jgi:hypothetical protein
MPLSTIFQLKSSPLEQLDILEPNILIDDSDVVLSHLQTGGPSDGKRIDIVVDNAGFELISDLCFAEFLLSAGLCSNITFACPQDTQWSWMKSS